MQVRVNRFAYIQGKYRDRVKGETIGNDVELVEKMKKKTLNQLSYDILAIAKFQELIKTRRRFSE